MNEYQFPPLLGFPQTGLPQIGNGLKPLSAAEEKCNKAKRQFQATCKRDPERQRQARKMRRLNSEDAKISDRQPVLVTKAEKEVKVEILDENQTKISIGNGDNLKVFCFSDQQKKCLIAASNLFESIFSSQVNPNTSLIALAELNTDLIRLAAENESLDSLDKLSFTGLVKLYDAACELKMNQYRLEIKAKCFSIFCKLRKGKEIAHQFRIIAEKMLPHTDEDLQKLYSIGINYPNLSKLLILGRQVELDPASDLHFMLDFMDKNRTNHGIDQFQVNIHWNDAYTETEEFLKTVKYWLPNLKKLGIDIELLDQQVDDASELANYINAHLDLFINLTELTISGHYSVYNFFDLININCPYLEKVNCHVARGFPFEISAKELWDSLASLKHLEKVVIRVEGKKIVYSK